MKRLWQGYVALIETISLLGISLVAVLGGLQVWFRYVAGNSLVWSEELMRLTMIWIVMLGAGLAYSRRQFLGMRFLVETLPPLARRICDLISAAGMLAFLGAIAWYGWKFAIKTQLQLSPTLGFSLFWVNVSIVVGAVLLAVHIVLVEILGIQEPEVPEIHE
ncbi:TRAP transporter small permease [Paracoccus aminophilus]|uniref:TRAP transporter small permease protein n=1 Tax=Paracoccus aminophilus JCM 7686 TaxID=1367847 RepID=S5XTK3_PARAH|nr:TRAP transporter small permease [Paracoccus aminophilus]AGT08507.1 tripartite ATP-independent periplasmic transporter DctQ [Paracoccus aminophilus JCM 7686]